MNFISPTSQIVLRNLSLLLLLTFTSLLFAQGIKNDSIVIHNFSSIDYKVALYNYDIIEDENGIIYIANDNGVLTYDGSSWEIIPIRGFVGAVSLKKASDGRIYVGGINEFGYLERDSIGVFNYHSLRSQFSDSLDVGEVWQVIQFKGNIYFQSYASIFKFDGEQTDQINVKDTWLLQLNDELLFSTFNKGISKYINDSTIRLDESFKKVDDAPFKSLPFTDEKSIVITEEHGLYTINNENYTLEKWNVPVDSLFDKHGLYDALVWDDSTYLFATTRKGIYWVNKKGEIVRQLTKAEGLNSNYMREFYRDSRGNMWLSSDGLSHIVFPKKQDTSNFSTLIRSISINDSSNFVNASSSNRILTEYAPIGSIEFHFATPGFDKSDLEYAYFLEGFDNSWSGWTENVKKEYTNLSSGTYTFNVKARLNNDTVSKVARITITIPALWYRTEGAYVIAVFMLILIVWAGASFRAAKLKQINSQLEQVVHERTKELVAQKEELLLANTELDNFVYRSSHDLIAPLKSLKGLITITRKETSEEYRQEYFQLMENSVVKLEDFIKSILEYSSNSKEEIVNEVIDLNLIIDNIIDDLKYFDQAEKVKLHRFIDSEIELKSDPKRLKIILSNLVANAVKYHNYKQETPYINVTFKQDKNSVVIEVEDNGQGIDSEYIETIFNMFVRASDSSEGSGLGLYIVKDTVAKLGAEISVHSELGKGTKFSIVFAENTN